MDINMDITYFADFKFYLYTQRKEIKLYSTSIGKGSELSILARSFSKAKYSTSSYS